MFKLGFELELISNLSGKEVKKLLEKEISTPLKLEYDPTIFPTDDFQYGHEIITPPLPEKEAEQLLREVYLFCKRHNLKSNRSTGFHVNVSFIEKNKNKQINPFFVLMEVDYDTMLAKWRRTRHLYCRSFKYYFDTIKRDIDHKFKPDDWTDIYAVGGLSKKDVLDVSIQKFVTYMVDQDDRLVDKYTIDAYNKYDEKHICMNLGYISKRGYIEFRMIGGASYLKNVEPILEDINHIKQSMKIALKRSVSK